MKKYIVRWKLPNWKLWRILEGLADGNNPTEALANYAKDKGWESFEPNHFSLEEVAGSGVVPASQFPRRRPKVLRQPKWPSFSTSHPSGKDPDWPAVRPSVK
jgi:hypothetical protein